MSNEREADASSVQLSSAVSGPSSPSSHVRTPDEEEYLKRVEACVLKPGGHVQQPAPKDLIEHKGKRLYAVTTIAASRSYGGKVMVAICETFERAKEIVETNEGDIWEFSYMLAVIEPLAVDWLYYIFPDERYWYRWNLDKQAYEAVEDPPGYENLIGFWQ